MIEPVEIKENRKIPLPEQFQHLLFDDEDERRSVVWHYYNRTGIAISNELITFDGEWLTVNPIDGIDIKNNITSLLDGGRYIRPPGEIRNPLLRQFEPDTQTLAEFIAAWVDIDEDRLIESYNPDTSYFNSRDELQDVLNQELPRFVFLRTTDGHPTDEPLINIFTQEQMETVDDIPLKQMLLTRDIVEDTRVLVAIEELYNEHAEHHLAQSVYLDRDLFDIDEDLIDIRSRHHDDSSS